MSITSLDKLKIPEGIHIPYLGGKWYQYISGLERKYINNLSIESLCLNCESREKKIIVSMTSFPTRIGVVGFAIKSLFNQTIKPDRIILWLAEEQFPDKQLPEMLQVLQEHGLEIYYCKEDLRSHKKYYYILQQQLRNELVITYDDDLIYPEDSIERLYKKHLQNPKCIVANRAACISSSAIGLDPYAKWKVHSPEGVGRPSTKLFPSTGGGVLYPFGTVNEEAFNLETMYQCAFSADDLWMRVMSALNHTKIIKTRKNHRTFTVLDGSQEESLQVTNCLEGGNDKAMAELAKHYPEAIKFILGDERK